MAFQAEQYIHPTDRAALNALKAIPGFQQLLKAFMKIWSERQFRILNMSTCVKMGENQLAKYYNMLPPVCEKLGIEVPELFLELDVNPNSYTAGDTKPFIVVTSGLFETLPEELIPTVLAHECGHIACHHVLFGTMGRILMGTTSGALSSLLPYGGLASMPLEIAFYHWMRCSELSADRAAVLCDGDAEKMSEVCLRLAGYDKDINAIASKASFMEQAREYRDMIRNSKWDKTLEFLALRSETHPLMTVRALECTEWAESDRFHQILDGTCDEIAEPIPEEHDENVLDEPERKEKPRFGLPKFKRKQKTEGLPEEESTSVPNEIRAYKQLLDEGILTEEEFVAKKKQLLGL